MKKLLSIFFCLILLLLNINISLADDSSVCGIGVKIEKKQDVFNNPYIVIVEVLENSSAQKAGIEGGDKIVEINNKNTNNMTVQEAAYSIRGQKGTNVNLLIKKDNNEQKPFIVTRDDIKLSASYAPKWYEFCPRIYVHADYQEYKPNKLKNFLLGISIIGFPLIFDEKINVDRNNYWVTRKYEFNEELKTCLADNNNQSVCFMQLRQIENTKNNQLRNEQIAQAQMMHQYLNNLQTQNQLQQINNNLDSMQNSLNMMKMNSLNPVHCTPDGMGGFRCY